MILTITLGISSYLHLRIQYNQLLEMSKEKLTDIAETIDKSIRTYMQAGKTEDVRKIIEAMGTLPDLEKVRIFSKEGIVLVSSLPEETGQRVDPHDLETFHQQKFATVFDQKNLEKPIFYIIKPIMNEPACFTCHGNSLNQINGVLDVEVSMKSVHERLSTVRTFMLSSTLVTLLILVFSILFLLSRLVNRPIQGLIGTMREAKGGNLSSRVEPDDTLEFEELGLNFNAMIARLEGAQKDLKKLHEQQMERVDRFATLGELAAGIAHEIKNPIAGIGGAIQILMQDLPKDDYRREIFDEILKQIDRIDRDVKDLLSYSRTEKPSLAEKDIHKVIEQTVFLSRERAALQKVDIETLYGQKIPKIELDAKQIQQVILNLVLNAIQAMPDGGILLISTRLHTVSDGKEFVQVQVKDTGQGIPMELLSKVFTPFFTTRHTGTGLGLPISQKIIHQHQGKIEVQSSPGKGTCFTILLPLARTDESV
jgi:signal transduction histidine kinase